ncbi:MAG TPA: RNA polymerase sigma factor [Draconibacterium sp.]|nr:RNA polymerase sigma factor [Draconibacterium sp.]HRX10991.1 RNA polymerase sigma factor [Draconibacterium sp.]
MEDLKNIIEDCVSGNVRAQETLYNMLAPKMFGVCLRYSKDWTEAEDSLQEGFIRFFTYLKNFRHQGSLEGWVRKIMVNVSLEKFRKQNIMYPVEDINIYDPQNYSENAIEKITADELIELIQELPPRYRMVFNLYVLEGMNHKEISEVMQISEGTSKSNLARGREILKKRVKELYGEGDTIENYTA